jgi:cytochrome c553
MGQHLTGGKGERPKKIEFCNDPEHLSFFHYGKELKLYFSKRAPSSRMVVWRVTVLTARVIYFSTVPSRKRYRLDLSHFSSFAGATAEQIALGERIFHGEAADGTCAGCHGSDANGSPQGPSLVSGKWLDTDGTFAGLRHTITDSVPKPKNSSPPMPPRGGAPLTDADVTAVAAYVWAISHPNGK